MSGIPTINIDILFKNIYNGILYLLSGDLFVLWRTHIDPPLTIIGTLLSVFFVAGIVYCVRRIIQISTLEQIALEEKSVHFTRAKMERAHSDKNERWEHVLELAQSDRVADWRIAILEADIMLDEMISTMGYEGATVGEKLKKIEASDFSSLQSVWEAHRIRNDIAHSGSDFILTEQTKKRCLELYRQAFEEFHFI